MGFMRYATLQNAGTAAGFVFSFLIFTTVLYAILVLLNGMNISYAIVAATALTAVLLGNAVKRLLA